eukprot:3121954-Rhodomonas_salina.1
MTARTVILAVEAWYKVDSPHRCTDSVREDNANLDTSRTNHSTRRFKSVIVPGYRQPKLDWLFKSALKVIFLRTGVMGPPNAFVPEL